MTIGHGPRVVVRGLSLAVEAGEVFGLLGPNGCGKSTTLSAVMGLLPFRGEIRVAGETGRRSRGVQAQPSASCRKTSRSTKS